jgi:DMSO reductase anchor subunit
MNTNSRTILFGVLIGAVTGLIAALMLNRRAENGDRTTAITAGEGIRLGVMVAGLLRAISTLGDEE